MVGKFLEGRWAAQLAPEGCRCPGSSRSEGGRKAAGAHLPALGCSPPGALLPSTCHSRPRAWTRARSAEPSDW